MQKKDNLLERLEQLRLYVIYGSAWAALLDEVITEIKRLREQARER